jgi:tetrapyrrole methylase family protein / MazG family protein
MNLDAICSALELDPLARGLQLLDARHLARLHFAPLDPNIPALIARCDSRELAAQCQRALMLLYPRQHEVMRMDEKGKKEKKRLRDLAGGDRFTPDTFLYIPPLAQPSSFNALADITAHLRAPNGCPWDREQTHQSLRRYLLEECYEVLETLDQGDTLHLREELGDLISLTLLQIQIAYEADEFTVSDVLAEICAKLIRRHPHVFGDVQVNGMDELLANWERIKSSEKGKAQKAKIEMPRNLPALMRAQMVVRKKKKRLETRDWRVEIERLAKGRNEEKSLGEALFALAAYAERNGIDAESALRVAVAKKV